MKCHETFTIEGLITTEGPWHQIRQTTVPWNGFGARFAVPDSSCYYQRRMRDVVLVSVCTNNTTFLIVFCRLQTLSTVCQTSSVLDVRLMVQDWTWTPGSNRSILWWLVTNVVHYIDYFTYLHSTQFSRFSADQSDVSVLRTCDSLHPQICFWRTCTKSFNDRNIAAAGARMWNGLLSYWEKTLAKRLLKTFKLTTTLVLSLALYINYT